MTSGRARAAVVVLVCSVAVFGVVLTGRTCADTAPSENRRARNGGTDEKPLHSMPLIPRRLGRAPASPSSARILAASPPERNTAEMDELYPGFHRAYRDAADADNMAFREQQIRECAELHAAGQKKLEWDEVQTYSVDETGRAVLSDLALVPATKGIDAFFHCIGEGMVGNRSFPAPRDTPGTFTVRENNVRYYGRRMSREEILAQMPLLEEKLREQDLSPERRELLEHTLAFWQCLLERGVDSVGRAACRREIDGGDK